MKLIEIAPLVGAGPILLGTSRDEVHRVMGQPEESYLKTPPSAHPTDVWFDGGLQVFYAAESATVEYIEISAGCGVEPRVYGINPLVAPASEVLALVSKYAAYDKDDPDLGYGYTFAPLELSLWRPDMEEPDGLTFKTIGIGVPGYYSNDA